MDTLVDNEPMLIIWIELNVCLMTHRLGRAKLAQRGKASRWTDKIFVVSYVRDDEKLASWELTYLGGGFKYVLFSPLLGEDSHFD